MCIRDRVSARVARKNGEVFHRMSKRAVNRQPGCTGRFIKLNQQFKYIPWHPHIGLRIATQAAHAMSNESMQRKMTTDASSNHISTTDLPTFRGNMSRTHMPQAVIFDPTERQKSLIWQSLLQQGIEETSGCSTLVAGLIFRVDGLPAVHIMPAK